MVGIPSYLSLYGHRWRNAVFSSTDIAKVKYFTSEHHNVPKQNQLMSVKGHRLSFATFMDYTNEKSEFFFFLKKISVTESFNYILLSN